MNATFSTVRTGTMEAVVLHEEGDPDVLAIEEVQRPMPGQGEVRVHIYHAALNHLDLWIRKGLPSVPKPRIMGADGMGRIEAVGPGVSEELIGERVLINPAVTCGICHQCMRGNTVACPQFQVLGEHRAGTHAEYVTVPAVNVHTVPDHLSDDQAAALPLAFATAWRMLCTRAQLKPGERVLIWGAGSGVSSAAISMAHRMGAEVIAVSRTQDKLDIAKGLGADHVLASRDVDIPEEVAKITNGEGVEVVFDHVGEATYKPSLKAISHGGRYVFCGATTGANPPAALTRVFWKQVSILGSTMATAGDFSDMLHFIALHQIVPRVDRVFDMEDIVKAHTYLESQDQMGKVVLRITY